MIRHLKNIHQELYLPRSPEAEKPPFKVTPINDPYLYTEANIFVDTFDNLNQTVKVMVSNAGGGRLNVERISIPRTYQKWIKRIGRSKRVVLTPTSEPVALELELLRKTLPNASQPNIVELNAISNSKRKTFSKITLDVQPPNDQSTDITLPEYINFGEITAYKILVADNREDSDAPTAEFLLIGDFTLYPPTRFEVKEKEDATFDAKIFTSKGELSYTLDCQQSGVVMPKEKRGQAVLKSLRQIIPIPNPKPYISSTQISVSDASWLVAPTQVDASGFETTDLSVSVNIEKLNPGRNITELGVLDRKIPVWTWYKIVKETVLTLEQEEPPLHHVEVFSEKQMPLPIDVTSTHEPYQSVMIFEDMDFQFPLTGEERIGYLIGDFNQWSPRTLFLKQTDDTFKITLSISEGIYLYRADIDNEMRLDPTRLSEIVCCSHGVASRLRVDKIKQKIALRNRSKEKIVLKLQSSTEWLQIEPHTVVLPPRKKQEITVVIRPERLLLGLNLGWIQLETEKKPVRSSLTPFYVMGTTNGAVPILRDDVLAFPKTEHGKIQDIPLIVDIFGEGELKADVQPSTVLRFTEGSLHIRNQTTFQPMPVAPLVHLLSERPANAHRKQIRASLVTDCYLANRRVHPFDAKYDMVRLISDPPALYFPKVYLFDDPHYVDITVKRSDGKVDVACSVEIPDILKQNGFLKLANNPQAKTSEGYRFMLNPQAATDPGRFSGTLDFHDAESGISLPIQFAADIVGGHAKIDIHPKTNLSSDGIQLVITNIGETELRIFDVQFKNLHFYLIPHWNARQSTLRPGDSIKRLIKLKKTLGFLRGATVRDTLIIRLNDPQFPNGYFEKEIVN